MEELVLIARIRRPHGVKGELLLESFTHDNERFKKLKRLFLRTVGSEVREVSIKFARLTQQGVLLTLDGITDRTMAEKLNGSELLIPISERPQLSEGVAYFDEMVGMDVVDDVSNGKLGTVTAILEMPAGDVVVFDRPGIGEHLVTMRGGEVRKIDKDKKELRVSLLEELSERSPEKDKSVGDRT